MKLNHYIFIFFGLLIIGCKSPEARKPITVSSGSFIDQSVARNKALNQREIEKIETIIASQPDKEFKNSGNGFWYYYNAKVENDSLQTPGFGDIINFNYNVKTLDSDVIYTKEEIKTQNYAMDQEEIFTGLREGLKLLKEGETATFLFPSQKAYGYYGDERKIGINTPIMCEVTVNQITENKDKSK